MASKSRVYVEGTQRGYAVGVETRSAQGTVRRQWSHYRDDGTTAGIDRAYKDASQAAASISGSLACAKGRKLLRREGLIPDLRRRSAKKKPQ